MAKTKKTDSLSVAKLDQTGLKKALSLLQYNGVEKIAFVSKDGSVITVEPSSDMEAHKITEFEGLYLDLILVKKGQNIEIANSEIRITSSDTTTLADYIIATVRDKIALVRSEITFSDKYKVLLGRAGTLADHYPKAANAALYAEKVLPEWCEKGFSLSMPKGCEVESLDQDFEMVVPAAIKVVALNGKATYHYAEAMLLIEISQSDQRDMTHQIEVSSIATDGKDITALGDPKHFNWQSVDSSISAKQQAFKSAE